MAIETVNIGSLPNDGTGDPLRTAFNKLNTNFLNITADGGDEITVTDPTTSTDGTLNDALANIYASGSTPDLQEVVTEGGVVISTNGLKKVEIDKDSGQIRISTRPTTSDAWVVRAKFVGGFVSALSPDGSVENSFDYESLKLQSSSALGPTEYKNDRIIYNLPDDVDDFISRILLLPTAYGIATDGAPYEFQKLALKPILNSYDFTAEIGVDYETDVDLEVTDPSDQVGSYRVFVANNNATIGGVAYPKGSRIYRYYDGTVWDTIVLATLDDIPTLDATPTNGSTNGVESNGVFDALALKVNASRFIHNGETSITGTSTESNICSFKIPSGAYSSNDGFKFDATFTKGVTSGTITFRVYFGTTSGARTNIIGQNSVSNTGRASDFTRRYYINSGNINTSVGFTSNASSGLGTQTVANTPIAIDTANDVWITITAQGQTSGETVGILGASITPLK